MIEKELLKVYLSQNEAAYRLAATMYENALYPSHILRQGLAGIALGLTKRRAPTAASQSLLTWNLDLPRWKGPQDVIDWLRSNDISVREGGHTFYIPPQPELGRVLGPVVGFYPEHSGFKVLKDLQHPGRARYIYKHRRALRFLARLIGSPRDQVTSANYMYSLQVGARLWDLTCFESQGAHCTVFVVDHVEGNRPTAEQCASFLSRLERLNSNSLLRILIPQWERHEDFRPPDCNRNLLFSEARDRTVYVDFQNFGLTSHTAWSQELLAKRDGRRNGHTAIIQWSSVRELLRQRSLSVEGRVVLDIGCAESSMLEGSLTAGAAWGVGWCEQNDMGHLEESLLSAGATRFSLVPGAFSRGCRLEDVPPHVRSRLSDAIVFWHPGSSGDVASESLLKMPWTALVCDGGDSHSSHLTDLHRRFPADQFEVVTDPALGRAGASAALILRRDAERNR